MKNTINLHVQFLQPTVMEKYADTFLKENEVNSIPVDIEYIIEYKYDMDIIPVLNLQRNISVEGYLSKDYSTIYVDEYVYENIEVRYRFTLAHEIGHFIMHKEYLDMINFESHDEWKDTLLNLNSQDIGWMEYQGRCFAGLVLVPTKELDEMFFNFLPTVDPLINSAKEKGFSRRDYLNHAIDNLAASIAPHFNVSSDVVERRIKYSNLVEQIP